MKSTRNRSRLIRIIAGALVYAAAMIFRPQSGAVSLALFLLAYAAVGGDILFRALGNILRGRVFDENFLMSLATAGAFAVGRYEEGVAVMLFYQVGELFQSCAVDSSRTSIAGLMDIRPDYANLRLGDTVERVDPGSVGVGDIIVIKPGERVPLDAVVTEGRSALDTSALTGESVPTEISPGDELLSGSVNISGLLAARVTRVFGESTASKILDLVENAAGRKSESENFITKFAHWYTPAVVIAAALLAAVPPLLTGTPFGIWLYRALVFLVVSCPCALVISIPLSFFGGIGGASRSGILVKGGNYLEALAKTHTAVFDKTGTLTKGVFAVRETAPEGISDSALLELAAYAESCSSHPISVSLRKAFGGEIDGTRIKDVEEIPGHGVIASVDGTSVAAGSAKLMRRLGVPFSEPAAAGTVVHVAAGGAYRGYIVIADEVKPDAAKAVAGLRAAGVSRIVMLTGDAKAIGESVAAQLGLDGVYAELLPADKVSMVEKLMAELPPGGRLVFAGDGLNDAPVLARADIGVAMGGVGTDAAIEAADAVIMTDEPSKLVTAIKIAKKTLRIVKQNIVLALSVKGLVLILGAAGIASMWAAVFADVGVAVLAILNAFRMLSVKRI